MYRPATTAKALKIRDARYMCRACMGQQERRHTGTETHKAHGLTVNELLTWELNEVRFLVNRENKVQVSNIRKPAKYDKFIPNMKFHTNEEKTKCQTC